jgi:hypothetical protein
VKRVKGDLVRKFKPKRNNRSPAITREDTGLRCHCKLSGLSFLCVTNLPLRVIVGSVPVPGEPAYLSTITNEDEMEAI